jgi:hypothetical protein
MTLPTRTRAIRIPHLGCVVLGFVGCCGGCPYVIDDRPLTNIRIARLRRELAEQLPVGSTEADARAWFDARDIYPTEIFRVSDMTKVGLGGSTPSNGLFGLSKAHIYIEIYFSSDGKLEQRSVRRSGPSF